MGLETNIYKAFEKNLKYIDNDGKEVNPLNDSVKGKAKVEELSKDLSLAIRDFILAQTFRVNKLSLNFLFLLIPLLTAIFKLCLFVYFFHYFRIIFGECICQMFW